jgi:cGMP-dependent protein kinase 2
MQRATPLQEAKSVEVSKARMARFKPRGSAAAASRPRADVFIRARGPSGAPYEVVASGHLDEVQELARGGTKLGSSSGAASSEGAGDSKGNEGSSLTLVEAALLGEGAFSRVSEVTEESTKRTFALKRMTMTAALQCPEHVYCEQHISKVGDVLSFLY